MTTKINLTNGEQVQGVLPRLYGGTGNIKGLAHDWVMLASVNDSGATIGIGSIVTRSLTTGTTLHKVDVAGEKIIGVVVGRLSPTTGVFEEEDPDASEVAMIAIAGRVVVNVTASAEIGDYVRASTTPGAATPSATLLSGTFGWVIQHMSSSKALIVLGTMFSSGAIISDHGGLTGLSDDDHTQYVLKSLLDAKGDIYAASADNTPGRLAAGSNGLFLQANSGSSLGVRWWTIGDIAGEVDSSPLLPDSSLSTVKDAANPTFNFDAIPESIVKVDSTYYCVFQTWATSPDHVNLASASDRDGPWTDLGQIYSLSDFSWEGATVDDMYAPYLMEDAGTFYLFYSVYHAADGTLGSIGYATATVVTGPYTDHGSAILSPGGSGAWDERRVGEPAVIHHDGRWIMAYMGESMTGSFGASEKVGIATASSPGGTWTKASGNPLITFGSGGEWDDTLIADPHLFFEHGFYWIMYSGGGSTIGDGTRPWSLGLAYALDPTGTWTKHADNPILSNGAGGTWEEKAAWRGSLYREDGLYSGVYGGLNNALSAAKGGNFRLIVDLPASAVSFATPDIALGTAAAAGVAGTVIRSDSTIVAFDTTDPVTQAFDDVPDTGSADVAARRDHRHGMPAEPTGGTGTGGPLLISDDHSTPILFADLLLTEEGDDLLYAESW